MPRIKIAPRANAFFCLLFSFTIVVSLQVAPVAGTQAAKGNHADQGADWNRSWPQWRGPRMDGVALHGNPPIEWSETKNIGWKIEIPGSGSSTPIIWRDLIFIQAAVPVGEELASRQMLNDMQAGVRPIFEGQKYVPARRRQRFVLMALDRRTGEFRWQRALHEEQPHEGIHPTNTWASGSPATDGEHVVAFFGSRGLFVLDMGGELVWERDLGDMNTRRGWGEGSSPALYGDKVIVNWDHEGESFLAAFEKRTGLELWRIARDEVTSWFTPLVVSHQGGYQIVTTGAKHVRGYDFETGELIWTGPGLTVNAIPSPVTADGRVYVTSGYRGNILLAILLDRAVGDLESANAIAWRHDRNTPYVSSPLLYRNTLYFVKHFQGILTSMDARTGQSNYGPVRLENLRQIYASPVAANGRIYLVSRNGAALVLEHGSEFKILATNYLDDRFDASPAVVGNELFLRGKKHLYRISSD